MYTLFKQGLRRDYLRWLRKELVLVSHDIPLPNIQEKFRYDKRWIQGNKINALWRSVLVECQFRGYISVHSITGTCVTKNIRYTRSRFLEMIEDIMEIRSGDILFKVCRVLGMIVRMLVDTSNRPLVTRRSPKPATYKLSWRSHLPSSSQQVTACHLQE